MLNEEAKVVASEEELAERQLLSRHRSGDLDAFPELLARFRGPVFAYLVRCGVEAALRDDLFQEIFLKIHKASGDYEPERPLPPWIFTIVANTARSHFRKRRVQRLVFPVSQKESPEGSSAPGHEALEARETVRWLESALSRLPSAQREVMVLCGVQGLAQQEVAEALGMPLNTVKTQLRRARLVLAKALVRRSGSSSEEVSS